MSDQDRSTPDPAAASAPVAATREPDMAMLEQVEGELADVEAVLPKIDDGTYGRCDACGATIPDDDLAEAPAARFCAAHRG